MAQLPEGITELLHHEQLSVPLVCVALSEIGWVLQLFYPLT